jgi:hypothetical protein
MKKISKIYKCECSAEALELCTFDNKDIEICFWNRGVIRTTNNAPTLKHRLWLCWQLITKGTLYSDEIILDKETAETFAKDIIELCKKK